MMTIRQHLQMQMMSMMTTMKKSPMKRKNGTRMHMIPVMHQRMQQLVVINQRTIIIRISLMVESLLTGRLRQK